MDIVVRKINKKGLELIKRFEGCELEAYPDPGTGGDPWTIGYGHTKGVIPGMIITQEQAEEFLLEDLTHFCDRVSKLCTVGLNDNQFSALVSFAYNVGAGNLAKSTLLKLLNQGDYEGASKQFIRWTKAAGKVLPGLVKRREAETKLFNEDVK